MNMEAGYSGLRSRSTALISAQLTLVKGSQLVRTVIVMDGLLHEPSRVNSGERCAETVQLLAKDDVFMMR